jgi:DNA adenine methylase
MEVENNLSYPCLGHDEQPSSQRSAPSEALERDRVTVLSPLRYPGSKRRLASYIKKILQINALSPDLFVEPFAGGASVALQLLSENAVDRAGLIDRDPLVAAFWKTVFLEPEWLIEQVYTIDITLERWKALKSFVPTTRRDRALACLFLNRTSFSGILAPGVGPLGGWAQTSQYRIDCRFPRETLAKRLFQIGRLKDRIAFVWNVSWSQGLGRIRFLQQQGRLPQNTVYYCDPPFFNKADQLYTYYFLEKDHSQLRDALLALKDPWILSYDSAARVKELYDEADHGSAQVELLYSMASQGGHRVAREVIVSNLPFLPDETRLWRSSHEWKKNTASDHTVVPYNTIVNQYGQL